MNHRELLQAGYRYALSLRARTEDAEDLVQEAWIRLHRRSERIDSRALLYRTIRNLYIDDWRRKQRIRFEPLDVDAEGASGIHDFANARMASLDLTKPLALLRSEEREALFLSVVEGYTAREISAFTGRPRNTVLSLIHRAKQKLRRSLAPDADPANVADRRRDHA